MQGVMVIMSSAPVRGWKGWREGGLECTVSLTNTNTRSNLQPYPHFRLLLFSPITISRTSVRQTKPGGVVVVIVPLLSPTEDAGKGLNTSKSFNNPKRKEPTKASTTKPTVLEKREGILGRALGWVPVRVCIDDDGGGGGEEVKRMMKGNDGGRKKGLEL